MHIMNEPHLSKYSRVLLRDGRCPFGSSILHYFLAPLTYVKECSLKRKGIAKGNSHISI